MRTATQKASDIACDTLAMGVFELKGQFTQELKWTIYS